MTSRIMRRLKSLPLLVALAACGESLTRCGAPAPINPADLERLYEEPLPPPPGPMRVYHIGHSLVGRDMPAMLSQLAGEGHGYEMQQGWGTSLKQHWEPDEPIGGFEEENAHPRYRDAREAVASGEYDALVVTESVEIRDAIRWGDSWDYLARWARLAWEANPRTRVYLYETWHLLIDEEGWLERLDRDLGRYWEREILARAQAMEGIDRPIYVVPGGQVMARFVRAIEAGEGIDGLTRREDLFAKTETGEQDPIHFNDLGAYLMALTHYAVLYGKSPVGLPRQLRRADGSEAVTPGPEAARLMQEMVWEVVTSYPKTGLLQAAAP